MHPVFTKLIDQVTGADIEDLCQRQWPEGMTVELKERLPNKKGGVDKWYQGVDELSVTARDEILAEIIAFANSQGGTLVLGISESNDDPKRATAVNPVPRCHDLAKRFEDAARSIVDPPLPLLQVRAVEMDGAGAGVLLFRTAASRSAPHRLSTTAECYMRRGASTVRMTMREIQDLTLNMARGIEEIERRLKQREILHRAWLSGLSAEKREGIAGIRLTAVPLSAVPKAGRLYRRNALPQLRRFNATWGGRTVQLSVSTDIFRERPILRGVRGEMEGVRIEFYEDGLLDLWVGVSSNDERRLSAGWILAAAANMLSAIDGFRCFVGAPDVEFGLDIECTKSDHKTHSLPVQIVGLEEQWKSETPSGTVFPGPLKLPRYSVASASEFGDILNLVLTDVYDAIQVTGERQPLVVEGVAPPRG